MMKTAIVTGATGFVGQFLVNELENNGITVYAIVRDDKTAKKIIPKAKLIRGDLGNIKNIRKYLANCDLSDCVFYHLAWNGGTNGKNISFKSQVENINIGLNCIELSKELGCYKFIGIGSILDKASGEILERTITHPSIIYSATKDYLNKLLKLYAEKNGIEYTWCRLSGIYGPKDKTQNLISYVVGELEQGKSPLLSEGKQDYSFIYVRDCARALYHVGINSVPEVWECFIGGPEVKTIREYMGILNDIIAPEIQIIFGNRPDDGIRYEKEWFDLSNLKKFGYRPETFFKEGIIKTYKKGYI